MTLGIVESSTVTVEESELQFQWTPYSSTNNRKFDRTNTKSIIGYVLLNIKLSVLYKGWIMLIL